MVTDEQIRLVTMSTVSKLREAAIYKLPDEFNSWYDDHRDDANAAVEAMHAVDCDLQKLHPSKTEYWHAEAAKLIAIANAEPNGWPPAYKTHARALAEAAYFYSGVDLAAKPQ